MVVLPHSWLSDNASRAISDLLVRDIWSVAAPCSHWDHDARGMLELGGGCHVMHGAADQAPRGRLLFVRLLLLALKLLGRPAASSQCCCGTSRWVSDALRGQLGGDSAVGLLWCVTLPTPQLVRREQQARRTLHHHHHHTGDTPGLLQHTQLRRRWASQHRESCGRLLHPLSWS